MRAKYQQAINLIKNSYDSINARMLLFDVIYEISKDNIDDVEAFHFSISYLNEIILGYSKGIEFLNFNDFKYLIKDLCTHEYDFSYSCEDVNKICGNLINDDIKSDIFNNISMLVKKFYTDEQLNRYIPLIKTSLSSRNHVNILNSGDSNLKYLYIFLISLAFKAGRHLDHNISYRNDLNSSIMACLYGDQNFDKSLLFCLSSGSIEELVKVFGGEHVYVPSLAEMEKLRSHILFKIREDISNCDEDIMTKMLNGVITVLENNKNFLNTDQVDRLKRLSGNNG